VAKKTKARKKPSKRPNPAAPKLRTDRLIPVRAVKVNKHGVVTQVVVEDRNMGKALKRSR
jgi:hypothetical protein